MRHAETVKIAGRGEPPKKAGSDRYWIENGQAYVSTSAGWLLDPESSTAYGRNAHLRRSNELAQERCLVLLGEPGIGKSTVAADETALVPDPFDGVIVNFDLGDYSSEDRLARDLLEDDRIVLWRRGEREMCLFLDGFDEALSRIENLPKLIVSWLRKVGCARMHVRFFCRTADWRHTLDRTLSELFGSVRVMELLPLRRSDIASANDATTDAFLHSVEQAEVVPLAARPITLNLLRRIFDREGSLPADRVELYRRGCVALVSEPDDLRRSSRHDGPDERLSHAGRMAAVSLLTGRPLFWNGPHALREPGAVALEDCVVENTETQRIQVRTVLESALFSGAGANHLSWSHATIADFLGAYWVCRTSMNRMALRTIFLSPGGRVYTALRGVAAWAVDIDRSRFEWLVDEDPAAFLSILDSSGPEVRAKVVTTLLEQVRQGGRLVRFEWDLSNLDHPGLSDVIEGALRDRNDDVVELALRIARASPVRGLEAALVDFTCDEAAQMYLRQLAALALRPHQLGSTQVEKLRMLAKDLADGASDESELWAAVMRALWPEHSTNSDVLDAGIPFQRRHVIGLHGQFLSRFTAALTVNDLPALERWSEQLHIWSSAGPLGEMRDSVVTLALSNPDLPGAWPVLRRSAEARAADYLPLFGDSDMGSVPRDQRRALAHRLIALQSETIAHGISDSLWTAQEGLLDADDFEWLVELFGTDPTVGNQIGSVVLLSLFQPRLVEHVDCVLSLDVAHAAAPYFDHLRGSVALDSETASSGRENSKRLSERRARQNARREPTDDHWVDVAITESLSKAETGDPDAYRYASTLVCARPGTATMWDEHVMSFAHLPRWMQLPEHAKQQFSDLAIWYLRSATYDSAIVFSARRTNRTIQSALRAFSLIIDASPGQPPAIDPSIWKKWAPAIVGAPTYGVSENVSQKRVMLGSVRTHAAIEAKTTIEKLVDGALGREDHVDLAAELSELSSVLDPAPLIRSLAKTNRPFNASIADVLVKQFPAETLAVLRQWALDPQGVQSVRRQFALVRLLLTDGDSAWEVVEDALESDAELVAQSLLSNSDSLYHVVPPQSTQALIVLYRWLSARFPQSEDPQYDEAHFVGPREQIGRYRNQVLEAIQQRASDEALDGLNSLMLESEDPYVAYSIKVATELREQAYWRPLNGSEITALLVGDSRPLLRSDSDLGNLAVESIHAIQEDLHSSLPIGHLLWDEGPSQKPKAEDRLSDFLANQLRVRLQSLGVIVVREPQSRRAKAGIPERPDIVLETAPDEGRPALRVPIEVKGAWNPEVRSAMRTQLATRYVPDCRAGCGIYVVFWFDDAEWSHEDRRRVRAARNGPRSELEAELHTQASELTVAGMVLLAAVVDGSPNRRPDSASLAHPA